MKNTTTSVQKESRKERVSTQSGSNVHVLLVSVAFGFMTATFVVSQLVDHLSSSFCGALRYSLFATAVVLAALAMR